MPEIFHQEYGTGQPIILLPGFCETHEIWTDFVPLLSSQFRVLTPDLPGFGKSEMLPDGFSLKDVATVMCTWIQEMNIQDALVIGHSLGGYVTLAMVQQNPSLLSGWGLFHSTSTADTEEKKVNRNKVIEFVKKNGVAAFIETYVPGLFHKKEPAFISRVVSIGNQTSPKALTGYLAAMRDRPDQTELLRNHPGPALIIAGKQDQIIPLKGLEAQAATLKNGTFSILSESAHMGMIEEPGQSGEIITRFALSKP